MIDASGYVVANMTGDDAQGSTGNLDLANQKIVADNKKIRPIVGATYPKWPGSAIFSPIAGWREAGT